MSEIARIFSTDPLKLTRDDLTTLISELRRARGSFQLGNVKAGSMKPKTEKQKAVEALGEKLNLEIDL